jgi:hypothetical protein
VNPPRKTAERPVDDCTTTSDADRVAAVAPRRAVAEAATGGTTAVIVCVSITVTSDAGWLPIRTCTPLSNPSPSITIREPPTSGPRLGLTRVTSKPTTWVCVGGTDVVLLLVPQAQSTPAQIARTLRSERRIMGPPPRATLQIYSIR